MSAVKSLDLVNIGRITAVYGVKGWVKIHSYTEIAEDVFAYNPWWLKTAHGVKQVEVDEAALHAGPAAPGPHQRY